MSDGNTNFFKQTDEELYHDAAANLDFELGDLSDDLSSFDGAAFTEEHDRLEVDSPLVVFAADNQDQTHTDKGATSSELSDLDFFQTVPLDDDIKHVDRPAYPREKARRKDALYSTAAGVLGLMVCFLSVYALTNSNRSAEAVVASPTLTSAESTTTRFIGNDQTVTSAETPKDTVTIAPTTLPAAPASSNTTDTESTASSITEPSTTTTLPGPTTTSSPTTARPTTTRATTTTIQPTTTTTIANPKITSEGFILNSNDNMMVARYSIENGCASSWSIRVVQNANRERFATTEPLANCPDSWWIWVPQSELQAGVTYTAKILVNFSNNQTIENSEQFVAE